MTVLIADSVGDGEYGDCIDLRDEDHGTNDAYVFNNVIL
jgi:hypothetical protein